MKKCTGENCPMQMGYDFENCAAIEKCPYRTWPVTIAISTCAPAWGATYPFPQFGHCAANFYSRPRVGGDIVSMGAPSEERISTHAPAWGATRSSTPSWWSYGNFYSRPRMGGDTIL